MPHGPKRLIFLPMSYPFDRSPILRLNPWLTDVPETVAAERPRGADGKASRRPHADVKVAQVRQLIEQTTLTYGQIAARTGVGRASICRWTRDQKWKRPPFAPVATDTVPRPRAGRKLKLRLLSERLAALAERHVRELEEAPRVDANVHINMLKQLKLNHSADAKNWPPVFDTIIPQANQIAAAAEHSGYSTLKQKWGYQGLHDRIASLATEILNKLGV